MKKLLLFTMMLFFVITLSSCFGNYTEGYKEYSRSVKGYTLYYQDLTDEEVECPQKTGYLYTLYSYEGNTFKYEGVRTTNGCYVPLVVDEGNRLRTLDYMLEKDKITNEDLEAVLWTFDFTVIQTPDYEVGSIDFIEYFEEVGEYDIYVVDHDDIICSDLDVITLYEYEGFEYDVVGAESGEGCISNYYIYYEPEQDDTAQDDDASTDDDTDDGELMTINEALQLGYITVEDINEANFESEIIEIYKEEPILATSGSLYYVELSEIYDENNPYVLTEEQLDRVLQVLSSSRYRYTITDEVEDSLMITLVDLSGLEHTYPMYRVAYDVNIEVVIAILTITDIYGNDFTYEIYPSGIRIVSDDLDVFAENGNQRYILSILDDLE